MTINPTPYLLPILLLFLAPVLADDQAAVEAFKETWTLQLVEEIHDDLAAILIDSGLSESDADRIIFDLATDIMNCAVEVAAQAAERRSLDLNDILSKIKSPRLAGLFRDEEEFAQLASPCFYQAFENAGIQAE